jgi:hypothetical protein
MKSLNYLVFIVFTLAIAVISCIKDDSTTSPESEMLTAKSWKLTSVKINGTESLKDCNKDDITTYSADGTFLINVGSTTCNGESNQSGTWSLEYGGAIIIISLNESVASCYIDITESKLTLEFGDVISIYIPA